jgi:hypothetical protein
MIPAIAKLLKIGRSKMAVSCFFCCKKGSIALTARSREKLEDTRGESSARKDSFDSFEFSKAGKLGATFSS